ncbi:MAG: HD domain-containing protein [Saprospiraceae bacterium]
MIRSNHNIPFLAGRYIARLFAAKLSGNLVFHNFHHTVNVVRGVKDIGRNLQLDAAQKEILLLAAWFHDSGHVVKYMGHEEESQQLAKEWLLKMEFPMDRTEQVMACIAATHMPQRPKDLLQQVICDADLYHLSMGEYCHLQFQLREEWKRVLHKEYTDITWMEENLSFINEHQYFTEYGQTVLEKRKQKNLRLCEQLLRDSLYNLDESF